MPFKLLINNRKVKAFIRMIEDNCYLIKAMPLSPTSNEFRIDVVVVEDWCYGKGSDDFADFIFTSLEEYEDTYLNGDE